MVWYHGFLRVSYVNICVGLLFRFGLVDCSIVSDLSLSDSVLFGVISWLHLDFILPFPLFDLKYIVVWVFFLQIHIQIRNRDQNMNCHYYCCYFINFLVFDIRY